MRITCSSCSATYDVPDSLITPGRIVRCARCGNEWAPATPYEPAASHEPAPATPDPESLAPEPETLAAEPAAEVSQSAMDRLSAHPAPPPSANGLRIAWAASLAVLVALAGAAYLWRAQVESAWPPSARAYALFGMHASGQESHR